MPIKVEHQPSGAAVGTAAFFAGRGKARQRQQKYALDMFRDERRIQAQRENMEIGFRYREALEGRRQEAMDVRQGLGHLHAEQMQEKSHAFHKARDDARDKAAATKSSRETGNDYADDLVPLPDDIKSETVRKDLEKGRENLSRALRSGQWDFNADAQREDAIRQIDDLNRKIREAERVDPMDELNQTLAVYDESQGRYRRPGQGERPTHRIVEGQPEPVDSPQAEAEAEARKAEEDAVRAGADKRFKEMKPGEDGKTQVHAYEQTDEGYKEAIADEIKRQQAVRDAMGGDSGEEAPGADDPVEVDPNTYEPVEPTERRPVLLPVADRPPTDQVDKDTGPPPEPEKPAGASRVITPRSVRPKTKEQKRQEQLAADRAQHDRAKQVKQPKQAGKPSAGGVAQQKALQREMRLYFSGKANRLQFHPDEQSPTHVRIKGGQWVEIDSML